MTRDDDAALLRIWQQVAILALTAGPETRDDEFRREQRRWMACGDADQVALNAGICPVKYKKVARQLLDREAVPRNVLHVAKALNLDIRAYRDDPAAAGRAAKARASAVEY